MMTMWACLDTQSSLSLQSELLQHNSGRGVLTTLLIQRTNSHTTCRQYGRMCTIRENYFHNCLQPYSSPLISFSYYHLKYYIMYSLKCVLSIYLNLIEGKCARCVYLPTKYSCPPFLIESFCWETITSQVWHFPAPLHVDKAILLRSG